MVASTTVEPTVQPQDEVDLTDKQIQDLLLEAEGRLRGPDAQPKELDIASIRYELNIQMTVSSRSEANIVSLGSLNYPLDPRFNHMFAKMTRFLLRKQQSLLINGTRNCPTLCTLRLARSPLR